MTAGWLGSVGGLRLLEALRTRCELGVGESAGAIIGAVVPSAVAATFGYDELPLMAGLTLLGAVVIGTPILLRRPTDTR